MPVSSDTSANPETGADLMAILLDLAAPQPGYKRMNDSGGFRSIEGSVISFDRDSAEYVLRHHELFSSRVEMNLGNVRPLIPLNVDPPKHSKYRKLLDPLFTPRRMDEH